MVLHYVSYAAALAAFLFVTLSLASGLLYIAEIIEERSQSAKRIGKQAIYLIIGAHVLFYIFDKLPLQQTALGIFCHVVYLFNFSRSWPFISLTSPVFMASCALVVADHFAWFYYFAERASEPRHGYGKHNLPYRPAWDDGRHHGAGYGDDLTFMDVATFFGICVWFIPFFLFLSLSANDNILPHLGNGTPVATPTIGSPTSSSTPQSGTSRQHPNLKDLKIKTGLSSRGSILKQILEGVLSTLPRVRRFRIGRTSSRPNEGLIASPSASHPPSPGFSAHATWGSPSAGQGYFPSPLPPSPHVGRAEFSPPNSPSTLTAGRPFSSSLSRPSSSSNLRGRASSAVSNKPPTPQRSNTFSSPHGPGVLEPPTSPAGTGAARKLNFDAPPSRPGMQLPAAERTSSPHFGAPPLAVDEAPPSLDLGRSAVVAGQGSNGARELGLGVVSRPQPAEAP